MAFVRTRSFDNDKIDQPQGSWFDYYRDASWRGVRFYVEKSERDLGRKGVVHTVPGSNISHFEDLGELPKIFQISGYIIGKNYIENRDNFEKALSEKGPGTLVHPYIGEIKCVLIEPGKAVETGTEGGIVKYTLKFMIYVDKVDLTKVRNTISQAYTQYQQNVEVITSEFIDNFSLIAKSHSVLEYTKDTINSGVDLIRKYKKTVSDVVGFIDQYNEIKASIDTLVLSSKDLANSVISLLSYGANPFEDNFVDSALTSIYELLGILNENKDSETAEGVEFIKLINSMIPSVLVTAITKVDFDSTTQANEVVNSIVLSMITVQDSDISVETFNVIDFSKESLISFYVNNLQNLGYIAEYKIQDDFETSFNITYAIYGELSNEEEILTRNGIYEPLFVSGKDPIKVKISE